MSQLNDLTAVQSAARKAVAEAVVTDIHTHLFPPSHGQLLLWGVDELLTYHYLVAELFTMAPRGLTPQKFFQMPKRAQADLIWEHVFLRHGAMSEACRGAITTLNRLGLDVGSRNLGQIRKWFDSQRIEDYLPKVIELAGLNYVVMTNNPFVPDEVRPWEQARPVPHCMKAALRIDTMLVDWKTAAKAMSSAGYKTKGKLDKKVFAEARRFLADWAKRIKPIYMAGSLGPQFAWPDKKTFGEVMRKVILPTARELNLPIALMIGVRKQVNPALGDGGDAVGQADVNSVLNLCLENPDVKFLMTMLSRVNQHELCVAARKAGNLHLFGCWWFCNNPSIIAEMTRQRLELLGANFTCQHSDARVLDQLIYKWSHSRKIVGEVLAEKCGDLFEAGWRPTEDEIRRDARMLLGGAFEEFLAK